MIRIYGDFQGEASLNRVSWGFARAFPSAQCFELSHWGNDLDESDIQGFSTVPETALFVGNLSYLPVAFRHPHSTVWVMVTPNSDKVGAKVERLVSSCPRLMTPSRWAQGVLRSTFPDKRIVVAPHGVEEKFRVYPEERMKRKDEEFRVLHLSSTILERKGTRELLKAWKMASIPNGKLFISVPPGVLFSLQQQVRDLEIEQSVLLTDRLNYGMERMGRLYNVMDLVCQPSRGEGFGMVPLEARACGTPALLTDCTGHSEHALGRGIVVIESGESAPVDDFPGAFAPTVSPEAIAEGLRNAYERRESLSLDALQASGEIRKQWSWENQLEELKSHVMS